MSAAARVLRRALLAAALAAAPAAAGALATAAPLPPQMHTVAGGGDCSGLETSGGPCDGVRATSVPIGHPRSVAALPGGGFLYVDRVEELVREVSPSGVVRTVAGDGTSVDASDGTLAVASGLNGPVGVAPLPGGGFLVTEYAGSVVRLVSSDDPTSATIATIAGTGTPGFDGDAGAATATQLSYPTDAEPAADGRVLIADAGNDRVRILSAAAPGASLATIAGGGACDDAAASCEGSAAGGVALHDPVSVVPVGGGAGGYVVAEYGTSSVRRISALDAAGTFTTVAGTPGHPGFAGDGGPALGALLDHPQQAIPASDGGVLIADTNNQRIRRVAPDGTISTVAGDGLATLAGDGGAATDASLQTPVALAPAPDGGFRIADEDNDAIRAVTIPPTTTIAFSPAAPDGLNGWYLSATVHATAKAVNGATMTCVLDPLSPPPVFDAMPAGCPLTGGSAVIAGDGSHTLYVASADKAGDKELPVSASLKIDATPPALRCRGTPSFRYGRRGALVSAAVADALSGPAAAVAFGAAPTDRVGHLRADVDGADKAGNVTTAHCPYTVAALRFKPVPAADWTAVDGPASGAFPRLVVRHVPAHAIVHVACRGAGCPFKVRSASARACRRRGCPRVRRERGGAATLELAPLLAGARLAPGAQLTVAVGRAGTVGWAVVLTVRASHAPRQRVVCLAPGSWTRRAAC